MSSEDARREKSRVEIEDLKLGVQERKLKIQAIERVVAGEPDPVTALEIVTVATHRGRGVLPAVYQRRQKDQTPLEQMAMTMLSKRLEEDPTDALERIIERRERLEDAADRLSGRGGGDDESTGNTLVDVARAVANSPLGEAIGAVFAQSAQQRVTAAAAAAGGVTSSPPAADSGGAGPTGEAAAVAPGQTPAAISGPRPVSFRAGMALRALKGMTPVDGARWILGQADGNRQLAELVGPFLTAEPAAVPTILEAFMAEAQSGADPSALEWVPVVAHLRENLEWTLACHAAMRDLAFVDDDGASDDDAIAN